MMMMGERGTPRRRGSMHLSSFFGGSGAAERVEHVLRCTPLLRLDSHRVSLRAQLERENRPPPLFLLRFRRVSRFDSSMARDDWWTGTECDQLKPLYLKHNGDWNAISRDLVTDVVDSRTPRACRDKCESL